MNLSTSLSGLSGSPATMAGGAPVAAALPKRFKPFLASRMRPMSAALGLAADFTGPRCRTAHWISGGSDKSSRAAGPSTPLSDMNPRTSSSSISLMIRTSSGERRAP
eukprot:CAMPEP_0115520342 /NCGR_PEP_ID=MMETSP0271-20121206/78929_1 /TAXON_ID=71861 /ORGANISM="Scrippsiella trochoidea, Strain CCMP3099" /LENGTH=106 /DNA_ID=CAMNT_0002951435 /DNA_START=184 /DNA_END=504 /DNA_ORIENTATION=-